MKTRRFAGLAALIFAVTLGAVHGVSQTQPPKEGPAVASTPAWFLQGSFPDPTGRTIVDANGNVTVPPREDRGARGGAAASTVSAGPAPASAASDTPPCRRSPLCGNRFGRPRQSLQRVQWKQA